MPRLLTLHLSNLVRCLSAGIYLSGLTPSERINLGQPKTCNMSMSVKDLPQKFDWSAQNVIGPVLDQEKVSTL